MSVRVLAAVWENSRARGTDLVVLLALADFAHDNGTAYPSVRVLARKARIQERAAQYALNRLEGMGELERLSFSGPQGTTLYRVCTEGCKPLHHGASGGSEMVQPVAPKPSKRTARTQERAREGRPSEETGQPTTSSAANRNAIWDALTEAMGWSPQTHGEKSRFGKSVGELLQAGARPEEVAIRWRRLTTKWRGDVVAASTERALVLHWGELGGGSTAPTAPCAGCGVGGGQHTTDCPTLGPEEGPG